MRARFEGTAAALPPREDDRDRRSRRLRRRDRPNLGNRRPLRLERPSGARRRWLARRLRTDRRPGGRGRRRSLPHALAGGDRRNARPSRRLRRPQVRSTCRSSEPCPSRSTPRHHAATSASSSPTCAPSGPPGGSSTSRTSSSGRPRSPRPCVDKIANPPSPDFRLVLLLPAKPISGKDDTRGVLGELIEADADAGRVLACTLYARSGRLADPVYVHAKIGIVDDAWLTLGSANLNEHSLFNDTEMNVVAHDVELAEGTRRGSGQSTSSSRSTRFRPIRSKRSTSSGSRSAKTSSSAAPRAGR